MNLMDYDSCLNDEFEIQHFGFSSTQFIADFKAIIGEYTRLMLATIEKLRLERDSEHAETIKNEIRNLLDEYLSVRDEVMLVAEPEIKKFFSIPQTAIPSLDWRQPYSGVEETVEDLEEEVKELETKLRKEQMFEQLCKKELEKLGALDPIYENVERVLKTKINFDRKAIPPKIEKLLLVYDDFIGKMSKDCPEVVNSIYKHKHLFE